MPIRMPGSYGSQEYKGYTIQVLQNPTTPYSPAPSFHVLGCRFRSLGEAQRYVDAYIEGRTNGCFILPGWMADKIRRRQGGGGWSSSGGGGGGGGGGLSWSVGGGPLPAGTIALDQGLGFISGGGGGGGGVQKHEVKLDIPDWLKQSLEKWSKKRDELVGKIETVYGQAWDEYQKAKSQVMQAYGTGEADLHRAYMAGVGTLVMEEQKHASMMRGLARSGQLSAGALEQAMSKAMQETAAGALQQYQVYAQGRTQLATDRAKMWTELARQATELSKAYISSLGSIPDPFAEFNSLLSSITGYAQVAST